MKKRHGLAKILLSLITTVALMGCQTTGGKEAKSLDTIRLADGSQPVFGIIYVAEEQGYFEKNGIEIEYHKTTSGRDALQKVIDGKADLATVYETPVVLQTLAKEELRVVSELHHSTKNTAIIARKDSGITGPQDLKGKKIAVTQNTNGEFFLFLYLAHNKIALDEIEIVYASPPDIPILIANSSVDAASTWNPHIYNSQKLLGKNAIVFYSDEYNEISMLTGQKSYVETEAETLHNFLKSLIEAEEFMKNNEMKAQEIIIHHLGPDKEETIQATWDDFESEIRLSNILLTILEQEAQWFIELGIYPEPMPSYRDVLHIEYLQELKPLAVTVF